MEYKVGDKIICTLHGRRRIGVIKSGPYAFFEPNAAAMRPYFYVVLSTPGVDEKPDIFTSEMRHLGSLERAVFSAIDDT